MKPTGGAHLAARERETGTSIREKSRWAAGWFLFWADSVPLGLLLFLLSFLLFFFWFLYLNATFAKVLQFKPNFFQRFSKRLHIILSQ
jgi:hypothetical protein